MEKYLILFGPVIILGALIAYTIIKSKGQKIPTLVLVMFCFSGLGITGLGMNLNLKIDGKNLEITLQETEALLEEIKKGNCQQAKSKANALINKVQSSRKTLKRK